MRDIKQPEWSIIVNKINSKQDFTHYINDDPNLRYVVGVKNLFTGKNPSMEWLNSSTAIDDALKLDSIHGIGGWMDPSDGTYYVDCVNAYLTLGIAMGVANHFNEIAIYDRKENKVLNVKDYYTGLIRNN